MEVYRASVFRSGTSLCEMRSHRVKGCDWLEEITRQQRTPLYQQVTVAGRAQGSIWAHLCQSPCHSPQRRAKGLGHFHPSFSSGADPVLLGHVVGWIQGGSPYLPIDSWQDIHKYNTLPQMHPDSREPATLWWRSKCVWCIVYKSTLCECTGHWKLKIFILKGKLNTSCIFFSVYWTLFFL